MLYRMRRADGSATASSSGTFVPARGAPQQISWSDVSIEPRGQWTSPRSGARYPSGWKLAVRSIGLEATVAPLLADQELVTSKSTDVTYWEGDLPGRGNPRGPPDRRPRLRGVDGLQEPRRPGVRVERAPGHDAEALYLPAFFSRVSSVTVNVLAFDRFR